MTHRWDFSEIGEAARLCADLLSPSGKSSPRPMVRQVRAVARPAPALARLALLTRPAVSPGSTTVSGNTRQDRLQASLTAMCERGGFLGAVVADAAGLCLAAVTPPVAEERLAALSATLGEALVQAGNLFTSGMANNLSLDLNYTDKLTVRRFLFGGVPFCLVVLCPQTCDERAEVELSVDELQRILAP